MKNNEQTILICIAVLCVGLMFGILIGRFFTDRSVSLSAYDKVTANESTQSEKTAGKININSATAEELSMLPGIGITYANRIVEYRVNNGQFTSIEQLTNVKGIGSVRYDAIKNYITVGG